MIFLPRISRTYSYPASHLARASIDTLQLAILRFTSMNITEEYKKAHTDIKGGIHNLPNSLNVTNYYELVLISTNY